MMDSLEGSTLDLIHRRRVSTFYPGYTIILIILGIFVALPLVKVDVVSTSGGMIRPCQEPVELFSSITGMVDSTLLIDNKAVSCGDTLIWMRRKLPDTRMEDLLEHIRRNNLYINDMKAILRGENVLLTARYRQSFKSHSTSGEQLRLKKKFLEDEYLAAGILFDQKVIPLREFEQARSEYLLACARINEHQENYRNQLEDELMRLSLDKRANEGELAEIRATLQNYVILAPISGTLNQCPGIRAGSVIQPGTGLGTISPSGAVLADCYVETRNIREIRTGMPVKIRMDGKSQRSVHRLETIVSQVDPDVIVLNGRPVYRVRCPIEEAEGLIPGMTFSASMLLYQSSLASLLTEKLNRHFNPAIAMDPLPGK